MRTIGPTCSLGEGPLWHPLRRELFWFDIPAGKMFCSDADGADVKVTDFGEPASVAGWIDKQTLLVGTASGLHEHSIDCGKRRCIIEVETDKPGNRSNDGRVGPDGSLWFGTMAADQTPKAGRYYRYVSGKLEVLMENISIPNATCFSPDGRTAYFADTRSQIIWRIALDERGAPAAEKEVHINLQGQDINPDGAVCDAQGYLWNAQWGASRLVRYAPDGSEDRVVEMPVSQPTCPAFGGDDLGTLFVTSAREGLSETELMGQTEAGRIFCFEVDVPGVAETRVIL